MPVTKALWVSVPVPNPVNHP